jgi:hypothetical protein
MSGSTRSFTVDGETGITVPVRLNGPHAFGAIAALDDGKIVVAGGISNIIWTRQASVEIFSGQVSAGSASLTADHPVLLSTRIFPSSAPLPDGGVLTTGGLSLGTDVRTGTLVAGAEVLYVARPSESP